MRSALELCCNHPTAYHGHIADRVQHAAEHAVDADSGDNACSGPQTWYHDAHSSYVNQGERCQQLRVDVLVQEANCNKRIFYDLMQSVGHLLTNAPTA